jgi:hypothetical protein
MFIEPTAKNEFIKLGAASHRDAAPSRVRGCFTVYKYSAPNRAEERVFAI